MDHTDKQKTKTITRKALITEISHKLKKHPTEVKLVVQELLDQVTENLVSGHRFEFRDFGVFEVVERKAKVGRNPKAPERPVTIPSRKAVKFSPGKKLKTLIELKST